MCNVCKAIILKGGSSAVMYKTIKTREHEEYLVTGAERRKQPRGITSGGKSITFGFEFRMRCFLLTGVPGFITSFSDPTPRFTFRDMHTL